MRDDNTPRPQFTPEELSRIARDWGAVMAAQQSLSVAVANMTDHLQRLVNAVQPPPGPSPLE
jgi:hypothetical protein